MTFGIAFNQLKISCRAGNDQLAVAFFACSFKFCKYLRGFFGSDQWSVFSQNSEFFPGNCKLSGAEVFLVVGADVGDYRNFRAAGIG